MALATTNVRVCRVYLMNAHLVSSEP